MPARKRISLKVHSYYGDAKHHIITAGQVVEPGHPVYSETTGSYPFKLHETFGKAERPIGNQGTALLKISYMPPVFRGKGGFHSGMAFVEVSVYVAEKSRKQGVSTELFQRTEDFAKEKGADVAFAKIRSTNTASINACKKVGWKLIAEENDRGIRFFYYGKILQN